MQAAGRLGAKKNEKNEENAELNCGSMFSLFFALTFFLASFQHCLVIVHRCPFLNVLSMFPSV